MLEDVPRSSFTTQMAVVKHLPAIGIHIVEDVSRMGNYQSGDAALFTYLLEGLIWRGADAPVQQLTTYLPDQLHVFEVDTGLRLIKEHEIRLLRHELKKFGTLDLPSGKPRIDVAIKKIREIDPLSQLLDIDFMPARAHSDQMAGAQTMYGWRTLEGHAYSKSGTLIHRSVRHILPLEHDPSLGDVVPGKSHERHEQGGFTRAIGAEQDKSLSFPDLKVDAFQDFLVADIYMKIFNYKHSVPHFDPITLQVIPIREAGKEVQREVTDQSDMNQPQPFATKGKMKKVLFFSGKTVFATLRQME